MITKLIAHERSNGFRANAVLGVILVLALLSASPRSALCEGSPVERRLLDSVLRVDPLRHARRLSSLGSRVTGYKGCDEAARYIESQFKSLGLKKVTREPFQVIIPYDHGARLDIGGKNVDLYCCWPNSARTSQTAPAGITGPLIWGEDGYFADFNGKFNPENERGGTSDKEGQPVRIFNPFKGSIVLMKFNTSTRWLNAAHLGAKAIIFLEPDYPFRSEAEQKYLEVPVPIPRYYLTRTDAIILARLAAPARKEINSFDDAMKILQKLGAEGGLHLKADLTAKMVWEERTVQLISGVVPGTNPEYRDSTYLYHSYYDSMSVVPAISPGAENSLGIGTLLESARVISENPPACTVKFLALPAHFQALRGMRSYAFKHIFPKRLLKTDAEKRGGEPTFAIGLDLSSKSRTMAAFYKAHFYDQYGREKEIKLQRIFADFNDILLGWAASLAKEQKGAHVANFISGIVPHEGRDWASLLPGQWAFDSEVLSMSARPALTFATCYDDRSTICTPLDTMDVYPLLSTGDLKDATAFAVRLKKAADPAAKRIMAKLSAELRASIAAYDDSLPPSYAFQRAMVAEINRLMANPGLFVTKTEPASLEAVEQANRLALESAFPDEIGRNVSGHYFTAEQAKNARAQARVAAFMLAKTAGLEQLPLQGKIDHKLIGDVLGKAIEKTVVAYLPNVPLSDAVVSVEMATFKSLAGVLGKEYVRSDGRGYFTIFGLATKSRKGGIWVTGFKHDRRTGAINMVGVPQQVKSSVQTRKRTGEELVSDVRLAFFRAACTVAYDLIDPLSYFPLLTLQVFDGASNSVLRQDEAVTVLGKQEATQSYTEPVAVVFTEPERRLKITMSVGQIGNSGVLLNSKDDPESFEGTGYPMQGDENFLDLTDYRIARDMFILDKHRIRILEKTGIRKENVKRLHESTKYELKAAQESLEKKRYDDFYRHSRRAWALEKRVYPDISGTADDAVRGVIFYFAILLPFVIFAERLLVNFADIRAKLAAIGVIFVISYLVLSVVHPAFRLSKTPIIILIGFFMCSLGLFIIGLLIAKFQSVTEQFRQRIATIHRADVARASAAMAAFILGISNMRKRKIRTALTCVTLILLTFTILSFTSFETLPASLIQYRSTREAPYNGVLIRRLSWDPVQEFVFYDIRNFFRTQGFQPALRSWYVSADKAKELQVNIRRADVERGAEFVATALLGLSPEEKTVTNIDAMVSGGNWFDSESPEFPFVCVLPSRMAEMLEIDSTEVGKATVQLMGKKLKVIGILNSEKFGNLADLDREPLTPVDYVEQQYKQGQEDTGKSALTASGKQEEFRPEMEESEAELYIHMEPDRVLIVPNELALKLGASPRSVAIAAKTGKEVMTLVGFYDVLRQYAERVSLALYAGVDGRLYRMATRAKLSMGGIKALIVPIIIAALIVFNTMLGAVFERQKEIKIYASVGLAPVHISALFFAESSVFATIGAMVGYLMGQTISRILIHFPELMEGMSLNYSSMSAVWSAFLVVIVVLLSTAYPARLAASLSVPDETRKMAIEKPTSDEWEIVFPFTVSSMESLGVMTFLHEYFASHDEDSIGAFSAADVSMNMLPEGKFNAYEIRGKVWVAPLDMGISQHVKILAKPDEEEPVITYLYFTISRLSGEFETWHRMNMGFMKDLRKQLLIWRLVTPEEKERLANEGRALLEGTAQIAAEQSGSDMTETPSEG